MITQGDFQREMRNGEEPKVDRLLQRAFGGQEQLRLVRKLRKSKSIAGEVVVPLGEQIIGYYALSWMQAPKKWLCLAPVAIDPEWQGQRQGSRMIGMLSEWARLSRSCVVGIGPSLFYEKAGFVLLEEPGVREDQGKGTIALAGPVDFAREQVLVYPKAISDLQTLA